VIEVTYHPKADDEVLESARFYERRTEGLGWRFLRVVRDAEARIAQNPNAFPVLDAEIRRCVLPGFPYVLLFRIGDERAVVVAVAHQSRRPGYWRRRLRGRV
jgi:plasmid stabilization system protein ParE